MTLKLNLLNYPKNIGTYEFLESVSSNNFNPQINLPTRITGTFSTLIDKILINSQENLYNSGNLTTFMSDHLCENPKKRVLSFRVTILLEIFKNFGFSLLYLFTELQKQQRKECNVLILSLLLS